jgi:hypothetical protein
LQDGPLYKCNAHRIWIEFSWFIELWSNFHWNVSIHSIIPNLLNKLKKKFSRHSLSRRQQNIGKKTTTTKKFSIFVICQIFPICWTIKLKFVFEHPFPRRQQKAKRCKAKQKNKKKIQKLTYFEMWNANASLEGKNTTLWDCEWTQVLVKLRIKQQMNN